MPFFQVQCWPNGKWNEKPYQNVEAYTAKEAAEKCCGADLADEGANGQIRAQVKYVVGGKTVTTQFYERSPRI